MYCAISNLNFTTTQLNRLESIDRRSDAIIKGQSNADIKNTKIYDLIKIRSCSLVEKSLTKPNELECFNDYFNLMTNNTRNHNNILRLPKVKLESGKNSFRFMVAKLFNDLPLDIRKCIGKNNYAPILKKFFNDK